MNQKSIVLKGKRKGKKKKRKKGKRERKKKKNKENKAITKNIEQWTNEPAQRFRTYAY